MASATVMSGSSPANTRNNSSMASAVLLANAKSTPTWLNVRWRRPSKVWTCAMVAWFPLGAAGRFDPPKKMRSSTATLSSPYVLVTGATPMDDIINPYGGIVAGSLKRRRNHSLGWPSLAPARIDSDDLVANPDSMRSFLATARICHSPADPHKHESASSVALLLGASRRQFMGICNGTEHGSSCFSKANRTTAYAAFKAPWMVAWLALQLVSNLDVSSFFNSMEIASIAPDAFAPSSGLEIPCMASGGNTLDPSSSFISGLPSAASASSAPTKQSTLSSAAP
mmetsp:Transcript_17936/g.50938  ORF Transcript_17936/g.50938 Transcript_17936/m.50938 type:complete len:283 (-) Transcript_17936:505-1353(-)